jgi:hypothetical protein
MQVKDFPIPLQIHVPYWPRYCTFEFAYLQQLIQRSKTITNEQPWKSVSPIIIKCLLVGQLIIDSKVLTLSEHVHRI